VLTSRCTGAAFSGPVTSNVGAERGNMDYVTFYNHKGRPVAWISDNQDYPSIFLFDGTPVAWISEDAIYDYSGKYLGWLQDGWARDRSGAAVFFTGEATGGPAKPARQARPARGARAARPARGAREARPVRPARSMSWSILSAESFFDQ
jgi:hypothetical protein